MLALEPRLHLRYSGPDLLLGLRPSPHLMTSGLLLTQLSTQNPLPRTNLGPEEGQCMAAVLQEVHTQAAWAGRWQGLPRDKLQQPQ